MKPPTSCPVCGAYSLTQEGQSSALLAVCDVLVLKALEKIGQRIIRADRSRFLRLADTPLHGAHTIWPSDDDTADKVLRGAWDVVPALLDGHGFGGPSSAEITGMLDAYVHDLVITGHRHTMAELAYRFTECLGIPVYLNEATEPNPFPDHVRMQARTN